MTLMITHDDVDYEKKKQHRDDVAGLSRPILKNLGF